MSSSAIKKDKNIEGKADNVKKVKESKEKEENKKDSVKKTPEENDPSKNKNEFDNEPPFGMDYAKTGRSNCKGCSNAIPKGELRISTRAKSYRYHGMMENWYHESCFWENATTDGISETKIGGLNTIKSEDQDKIRKKITEAVKNEPAKSGSSSGSKSDVKKDSVKKAPEENDPSKKKNAFDNELPFGVDYAKTGRSNCKGCTNGELRISTRAKSYRYHGMMENWYHESCFWENATTDGISESKMGGFNTIKSEDQIKIRKKITEAVKNEQKNPAKSGSSKRKSDGKKEEVSQKKSKKADSSSSD
uniref:PARP-type domain-containing protein n=1 Tax=Panagrolaimus sp. ES5 TaxID=591445 RepID=A0AC34F6D6_9BILA